MKLKEFLLQSMITHLLHLCKRELELEYLPKIELIDDQFTVGGGTSFGEFNNHIKVVTTGRHPMDIMRTLTHELVHWKQKLEGMSLDGSDGSETENQANSLAGIIMRKFGQMYPHYFMDTLP